MPHILLVEDDPILGPLTARCLLDGGFPCTWAQDATSAMGEFLKNPPDLLLLDLMLPDRSGLSLLTEVRRTSSVPVILLTARTLSQDKVLGLDLGADDYLTKPFSTEELLARIRALLRRAQPPEPASSRLSFGSVTVDEEARTVTVGDRPCHVTPTEFEILRHLLVRAGRAVRREQLAEAVLLVDDPSGQVLQTHVSRLRTKLGGEGARIITVWGIGYRLDRDR